MSVDPEEYLVCESTILLSAMSTSLSWTLKVPSLMRFGGPWKRSNVLTQLFNLRYEGTSRSITEEVAKFSAIYSWEWAMSNTQKSVKTRYGRIPMHLKSPIAKAVGGDREAIAYLRGAYQVYKGSKTGDLLKKAIDKCTTST